MPGTDTGHLPQALMCLSGQLLGVPAACYTLEAMALRDSDDVDHLVLAEHGVHRHLLLQLLSGPVDLLSDGASINLDLHNVRLLLTQGQKAHLCVGEHADDLAVFLHAGKVFLQLLLALLVLPFLTVLGEGLLLGLVPVLVETPLALVTDVLGEDGFEGAEAAGGLHVAHEPDDHHRGRLNNCHRLHHLLLVHLGPRSVDLTNNVGHSRLVSQERRQVDGLAGVILGEALDLAPVPAASLAGQEAQGSVTGS
uniref:Uncharacterized protein n=1 Tax=Callorhinchus milii TaxID=7868 RepID=V9L109_CALMI